MSIHIQNALRLAWIDTLVRYKKSYLGPFWYTISNFFGIVALSLVWAELIQEDLPAFVPRLAIGLVLWQLISGVLTESPRILNDNSALIKNINIPIWFLPARLMFRQVINFLHNMLLVSAILIYFRVNPFQQPLSLALGLLTLFGILALLSFMLAGIGARYRDVRFGIETIMPLLFFVSPVVFKFNSINSTLINMNPLTYMIELVRLPVLGVIPDPHMYLRAFLLYLFLIPLAYFYYKKAKNKMAFWVN
jgi:ABC-type polysaccharide/polyol phosphate export permease